MRRPAMRSALLLIPLLLVACARAPGPDAAPQAAPDAATLPAGFAPAASILDLMQDPIDPLADDLWEAVATVSTEAGTVDQQPATDDEWLALRGKAITMMEAANLLVIAGRPVGHPGQKVEGLGESTDLTPAQAQAEIDKDRASFVAFARLLQESAGRMVAAIDARNVDQYLEAGGALDEACEACHRRFWYPASVKKLDEALGL